MKKLCLAILCLWVSKPLFAVEARITEIEGEVEVLFSGTTFWVAITEEAPLEEGDVVKTGEGSRVEIGTPEGTVLSLEEKSSLTLSDLKPQNTRLTFSLGSLLIKIMKRLSARERFSVETPAAVLSVRGTEFGVAVDEKGEMEAGVQEGEVELSHVQEPAPLVLKPQEGWRGTRGMRGMRLRGLPPRILRYQMRLGMLKKRAEHLKARWRHLPLEKRREIRQKMQMKWQSLTPRQRYFIKQKRRQEFRRLPPEKKREIRERMKERRERRRER